MFAAGVILLGESRSSATVVIEEKPENHITPRHVHISINT